MLIPLKRLFQFSYLGFKNDEAIKSAFLGQLTKEKIFSESFGFDIGGYHWIRVLFILIDLPNIRSSGLKHTAYL